MIIKQLISDLVNDKITLTQALTRSKIIAYKVKNSIFTEWLTKEVSGYNYDDPSLPEYRKVRCSVFLKFGNTEVPFSPESSNDDFTDSVKYHRFVEPIAVIEMYLNDLTTPVANIPLAVEQYQALFKVLTDNEPDYRIYKYDLSGGFKKIPKAQVLNIIELTKQKLLDALLQLDSEFPNLENQFEMSQENIEKVQNIITNNFHGNNNPVSIAAGYKAKQGSIKNSFGNIDYTELEKMGVGQDEIQNLRGIMQLNEEKKIMQSKAAKWLGSIVTSMAANGLYNNIPAITDFIHRITG